MAKESAEKVKKESSKKGDAGDHTFSDQIRTTIQKQITHAKEEVKRELFKTRLELARTGIKHYENKRIRDAVECFITYLKILEEWKKVPEGELLPSHFDKKEEKGEMLLLAGVYWDLAKLYDRTKSNTKRQEFKHYLDKFVIFSKATPFQGVSAESLRKYIVCNKPIHKEEFKNAYQRLKLGSCFIATELKDLIEPSTMNDLYRFRDDVLEKNPMGQQFIRIYYRMGPVIARGLHFAPASLRKTVAYFLTQLTKKISRIH